MLINNINITTYSAELIERYFTNHEVVNINDWLEGSPSPVFLRQYERYKDIKLVFLIKGDTEAIRLAHIDKLIANLKVASIKFDDLPYTYDTHMEGKAAIEKLNENTQRLEVSVMAHATRGEEVSVASNKVATKSFSNTGTLEAPATITISPTVALPTFTITGLTEKPLVLKNLVVGSTYIVDGYTYRFLRNGASDIDNFASFEFPKLKQGTNNVGFSATTANVSIKYFPKFN